MRKAGQADHFHVGHLIANGIQDNLSLAAIYIRLLFGEAFLANGSVFMRRHEGLAYLASNWHSLTGFGGDIMIDVVIKKGRSVEL